MQQTSPFISSTKRVAEVRGIHGLKSTEWMTAMIQRESARADRSKSELSLVLFPVKKGKRQALSTMRLARTLASRVRATDEIGWYDENYICALLPDTKPDGAKHFADDVCELVAEKSPRPVYTVYTYPSEWMKDGDGGQGPDQTPKDRNDNNKSNGHPNTLSTTRKHEVNSLMPYFLEGVKKELDGEPVASTNGSVHRLEHLLAKPLPLWKRAIDIAGSACGLLLLSPMLLIAAAMIKLTSRGPVIFQQKRAGLGGVPFTIYKFRTMCIDAEAKKDDLRKFSEQDGPAFKMKKDPRVTSIGKLLRKTSIDELPQLINVFKGNMTLVGPRPLPMNEADKCDQWQRRRLDVTPGLTCIWQVKGRSSVTFAEWVRMDVAYIRRRSVMQDISILLQTVPAVLLRKGAS